jgi:transposase InsO family protein
MFKKQIVKTFYFFKKIYGAVKIHIELLKQGFSIGIKRVQKIMKNNNFKSIIVKKYKPHYDKNNDKNQKYPNLLKQNFSATKPNEKWVSDITYIHTINDGWCYLASVMDLYTKKIVGFHFSKNMKTVIIMKALNNAIISKTPKKGLIVHSDRGSQYTSNDYQEHVKKLGFRLLYSKKGCPYDNACIESFHASLKKELVYNTKYSNFKEARLSLFEYIESFYNRIRIHSSLNYLSPNDFEKKYYNVS